MSILKRHPFASLLLILYLCLLTVSLLYFRFPEKQFLRYLELKVEQVLPETLCSIADISYTFPFTSLQVTGVSFKERKSGTQLFSVSKVKIQPDSAALLSAFHLELLNGEGRVQFFLELQYKTKEFFISELIMEKVALSQIPVVHTMQNRAISGKVNGQGSFRGRWPLSSKSINGEGHIRVTDGSCGLLFPVLSLNKLVFQEVNMDIILTNNRLQWEQGRLSGRELRGEFSGNIHLTQPYPYSRLSMDGRLEPLEPLLEKSRYARLMFTQLKKQYNMNTIPFQLQGTVRQPYFYLRPGGVQKKK